MKKVGRIVERQNLKQENQALKNIFQRAEVVVRARHVIEEAFQRGLQAGLEAAAKEQEKAKQDEEKVLAERREAP